MLLYKCPDVLRPVLVPRKIYAWVELLYVRNIFERVDGKDE